MTRFKIDKGIEGNLPTIGMAEEGHMYVTSDKGNAYFSPSDDGNLVPINRSPYYLTCATAAGTAPKSATMPDGEPLPSTLRAGIFVVVKFAASNTATSPSLKITDGFGRVYGPIAIKEYGTTAVGGSASLSWRAGEAVAFLYDGTNWLRVSHIIDIVQSDWEQVNTTSADYVKNKPAIVKGAGDSSIQEGNNTSAVGSYSHAEGLGTETKNASEHAEGEYNLSSNGSSNATKTMHSVGIGTSTSARKNALDIRRNGDVYIDRVGNYNGTGTVSTLQQVLANLESADANFVKYDDVLQPTNAFGGKKLYINSVDDAFYAADKRFWVKVTTHLKTVNGVQYPYEDESKPVTDPNRFVDSPVVQELNAENLFNGSYENSVVCPVTHYMKVHIQFAPFSDSWDPSTTTAKFPSYPYGSYYLNYYDTNIPPRRSQVRIYNNHTAGGGKGWKLLDATVYSINAAQTGNLIEELSNSNWYGRTCVEFIIYGNDSGNHVSLTQIDYKLNRPDIARDGSTVNKYGKQSLYYDFEWYNHVNDSALDKTISLSASTGEITANKFKTKNGTSSQFVKGDGSLDSNLYTKKVSSSTDNAVVRFDGTQGAIQNSGVTINDSNHITAAKFIKSGGTGSQILMANGDVATIPTVPTLTGGDGISVSGDASLKTFAVDLASSPGGLGFSSGKLLLSAASGSAAGYMSNTDFKKINAQSITATDSAKADLNDYKTVGTYITSGGPNGSSVQQNTLNTPTGSAGAFMLVVLRTSSDATLRKQIYIQANGSMWSRDYASSSWSSWSKWDFSSQVQSNWNEDDDNSKAHVLNRPNMRRGTAATAVVEGDITDNVASGAYSHAEGSGTIASGGSSTYPSSHAEGMNTTASGNVSHAEGFNTNAAAFSSHAEGGYTQTSNYYEHAQGRYNTSNHVNDTWGTAGNTIHSIGIGTSDSDRKNAVEVMQNGDVYVKGIGNYNGKNPNTTGISPLHTVISGLATDATVVHKTGAETIVGNKTFTGYVSLLDNVLTIDSSNQAKHPVGMSLNNYYDDGGDGVAVLAFDDSNGDGNVILRFVHDPIESYDAATKGYVDNIVGDIETLLASI